MNSREFNESLLEYKTVMLERFEILNVCATNS